MGWRQALRPLVPKEWVPVPVSTLLPGSVTSSKLLHFPESKCLPLWGAGLGTSVLGLFPRTPHWLLPLS